MTKTLILILTLVIVVMAMGCGETANCPKLQPVYELEAYPGYWEPTYWTKDFLHDALEQTNFVLYDGTIVEVGSITLGYRYKVPEYIDHVVFTKDGKEQVVKDLKVFRGDYEYSNSTWTAFWMP